MKKTTEKEAEHGKKLVKKLIKIIKSPILAISLLAIGGIALALVLLYAGSRDVARVLPTDMCVSDSGLVLIDSGGFDVYGVDGNTIRFRINEKSIDIGKDSDYILYEKVAFDEHDNVYALVRVGEAYRWPQYYDVILMFDQNGNFVRELCRKEHRDADGVARHEWGIRAFSVSEGTLQYVLDDQHSGELGIVRQNLANPADTSYIAVNTEEIGGLHAVAPAQDGGFAVITLSGAVGILGADGEFREWCGPEATLERDIMFCQAMVAYAGGNIYAVNSFQDILYRVEEDGTLLEACRIFDDAGTVFNGKSYSDAFINDIFGVGGKLGARISTDLYILEGSEFREGDMIYDFPLRRKIEYAIRMICVRIFPFFLIAGAILGLGCLMRWRISLLSKLLLLAIPAVIAMNILIFKAINTILEDSFYDSLENEMIMLGEVLAEEIGGEQVDRYIDSDFTDMDAVWELHDRLYAALDGNGRLWGKGVRGSVYLRADVVGNKGVETQIDAGAARLIVDSNYYYTPLSMVNWFDPSLEPKAGTDSMAYHIKDYYSNIGYAWVITPLYSSDGQSRALLLIEKDDLNIQRQLEKVKDKYLELFVVSLAVLVLVISIVCLVSIKYLKKASEAVAVIAKGDFSARIRKMPRDEVGDICRGVNSMAGQLEEYFEMKTRNERFYYKFVPEKFRELLHKENFTDLSLGDAESIDLTVLFCDIRSFSLNSEMMTAKESFEFINIIYGIAGPIIREHGGFIDKYIGDAVMALFEDADAAVAAGIELYNRIVRDPETAKKLNVDRINIGVGIHSGMARIGIVGESERMSGTVISDTVNLSSRLESLTKRYSTAMLLSKDTLDRLSHPEAINMRYLGMVQVAGVNEVKTIYEVLDCLDEETARDRAASRETFRNALRAYHTGDFDGALSLLEQVQAEHPDDSVAAMYLEYVRNKISSGNTEHAVFRFTMK